MAFKPLIEAAEEIPSLEELESLMVPEMKSLCSPPTLSVPVTDLIAIRKAVDSSSALLKEMKIQLDKNAEVYRLNAELIENIKNSREFNWKDSNWSTLSDIEDPVADAESSDDFEVDMDIKDFEIKSEASTENSNDDLLCEDKENRVEIIIELDKALCNYIQTEKPAFILRPMSGKSKYSETELIKCCKCILSKKLKVHTTSQQFGIPRGALYNGMKKINSNPESTSDVHVSDAGTGKFSLRCDNLGLILKGSYAYIN